MTLLAVEGLAKRYGGLVALHGVTFGVEGGEILGIIGADGAASCRLQRTAWTTTRP